METSGMDENSSMDRSELLANTVEIVSAYASNNAISGAEIPALIQAVFERLGTLDTGDAGPASAPTPAVPIRRSVTEDHIVCLECGRKLKMPKRSCGRSRDDAGRVSVEVEAGIRLPDRRTGLCEEAAGASGGDRSGPELGALSQAEAAAAHQGGLTPVLTGPASNSGVVASALIVITRRACRGRPARRLRAHVA
jgi:hypothetical protein